MVVSEEHQELPPLVRGIQDGSCVPAAEDVPSVTSSQRRDDEDRVVFLVVPGLADDAQDAAATIEAALKGGALDVRGVQLDLLEKMARIELSRRADEATEAALADELRRATPAQLVAYPVWQHRERIVRLRVDGMRCMTNCGRQVIRALEQIPGVLHIHVDSKSKTAEVALAKGCTATEVDLIKYIRAANPRFNASIAKEKKQRTSSVPGAILLNVTGMSCAKNCATKVQAALQNADGVIDATVDFGNKRATIILEPESKVTEEDLVQVVRSAGTKFDASRYELFSSDGDSRVVYLQIDGMSCAKNCARKVQDALNGAKGVINAKVDFDTKRATIFLETGSHLTETNLIGVVHSADQKFTASIAKPTSGPRTILLVIEGMSCAKNCAAKIERALNAVPSVESATVDFPLKRATVLLEAGSSLMENDLIEVVRSAGAKFEAAVYVPSFSPRTVLLEIEGMSCAKNCARKVQQALSETDGVVSASVDFESKRATVEVDPDGQFNDEDLLQVVQSAGSKFRARLIKPTVQRVDDVVEKVAEKNAVESQTKSDVASTAASDDVAISIDSDDKAEIGEAMFVVGGMTCTSCSNSVENALKQTEGVISAVVSFATEKATVRFDKDLVGIRTLVETVEDIGYDASYVSKSEAQKALGDQRAKEITRYRVDFFVSVLFTFPIILIMMVFDNIAPIEHGLASGILPGISWQTLIVAVLATPVQFYPARRFHVDAWKGMKNRVLGMSFLVSMGANASYFYGMFSIIRAFLLRTQSLANPDMFMTSSMLISFVILGKFLESIAKGKTSAALSKLMELQVKSATLLVFSADGIRIREERVVPIELVQRGDVLKVVRGSSIPADGVIVYGEGRIDESMLTGESKTIKKTPGDRVLGATVNVDGLFHMKVTGVDNDTALSQIIRLVEDAQTSKAPIQAYADYVASIFVPTVLGLSFLTFSSWYLLCIFEVVPESWIPHTDSSFVFAFNFGIATLVVACPCALGLATPTAVMVGTGVGAEHGVLIKGGEPLQAAHNVNTILFDKTGTLTVGKPVVTDVVVLSKKLSTEELIIIAGSAELGSEHPLSKAIIEYAKFISSSLEQPTGFRGVSGRGIACMVGEHKVVIGNREWMADNGMKRSTSIVLQQATLTFQNAGKTTIYMGVDDDLAAVFGVADAPRKESIRTLKKLKQMGLEVWMVTGDNACTAFTIADQLGISRRNVMADVVPSQKASKVKQLQSTGRIVAMVGDGINDSPALAQADLGIAIGGGTEIAVETAGMVLMKANLFDVITALDLSRTIFNRIRLNYVWALGYNCLLIPLAAGVLYPFGFSIPPMFAGGAMAISSVSVVTSSLLLRYYTPPALPKNFSVDDSKSLLFKKPTVTTPLLASSTLE
ncbi:serine/threonine protein kinase Ran1 [Phytophthora pseudosyringae]|uniref:Serine/threonine protein kinase Ran1 n=1 Tax=Phytophthora pseudosyringae TaxID=221518 RepID=A0A8T1WGP8_9STRA|nr:serine/threonine protein kinase Ran1 [Phytophthora pseudosyringae]